jgi:hypothetical protein
VARAAILWAALALALAAQDDHVLPDAPGKAVVVRVCTACHKAATFTQLRLTREEWTHEVRGMIERGARANRKEAREIVNYLVTHFGLPKK